MTTDDRIIWDTWLKLFHFPVVSVADEVGTFVAIADRPKTTAQIATETSVNERALLIHLGLLAALGFVERREGLWRATAATRTWLLPQADGYTGPLIHRIKEPQPFHAQLLQTLRTGDRATTYASAAAEWERGEMPPDFAKTITAFMNAHSRASSLAVGMQSVFGQVRSLLDVGGGSGIFAIEVAKAWPKIKATVMEINTICLEADGYIAAADLKGRVNTQSVNMFVEPWPKDYDAHFFSNIFHDWSDDTCRMLARKSFEALPSSGRILLHEMLINDDGCGPEHTAAFSLLMLIGTKGRQYTLPELRDFLASAGFVDIEAAQTAHRYYSLVSARKP